VSTATDKADRLRIFAQHLSQSIILSLGRRAALCRVWAGRAAAPAAAAAARVPAD